MVAKDFWAGDWRARIRTPHFWLVVAGLVLVTVACVILRKMEHPWEGRTGWRIRHGKPWGAVDYGRYYGFWVGLAATAIIGCTVITSRWWWKWAHPASAASGGGNTVRGGSLGRQGWLILALILLGAGWLRGQHLDRFILRDEQDTIRYHLHGFYEENRRSGALEFVPVSWADAAFGNRHGNNPVLMTVVSRAALEIWWRLSQEPRERYDPVVIRLPGFLAGMASIAVLSWCLLGFAPRRVALIGAAIAAIHPMHIDFSIQARGYAYVLLGVPLALGGAIRALQGGRWRDWIALVGGCAIVLYSYLGGLFFVAPLVLTVFGVLLARWRRNRSHPELRQDTTRDITRLCATGLIGVPIYLTLAIPAVMGLIASTESFPRLFPLKWPWWVALWTDFASGRTFNVPGDEISAPISMREAFGVLVRPEPWVWIGMLAVVPVTLFGLVRLWKSSVGSTRAVMTAAVISPLVQLAVHVGLTRMVLFVYYFIYWLPPLICLAALGMDGLATGIARRRRAYEVAGGCSRPIWIAATALMFVFLYSTVGAGGNPHVGARRPPKETPTVYSRGRSHWISYPEGRTLRIESSREVPERFPLEDVGKSLR
jgi:hypothetical protein